MSDDRRSTAQSGGTAGLAVLLALSALGAVALLVYLFDPDRGTARRTQLLDQIGGTGHRTRRAGEGWTGDLTRELQAVPHELAYRSSGGPVSDDVIVERVRSELGHQVRHAGAIEVRATNGLVTLSGPVLADEMPGVLATVHTVPGVKEIDDRLEVHQSADSIPALQG